MFGLTDNAKGNKGEFLFDLEREAHDAGKGRQLKENVVAKTKRTKTLLRSGLDKEDFDRLGILLQGYTSLQKVIARAMKAK